MGATSESKKMIMLRSSDGEEFEIEENVAKESRTIKHMIEDDCGESVISLPNVSSKILSKMIEYSKTWDAELVNVDQATIFDLIMQWQFQSDPFFPTKKEESRNMKKEESEDSKAEKTNGMIKKANTEDTKKEEAKDMEKEETDYVQDVEMEDREAEDSKLLEDKNVIKEQDNKDVVGKVEEIKDAEGEAEESRKKWIRGPKGSEKGEAEEKKESENKAKEGCRTPLKDIPNVAHKVGKKKSAELKLLHQTLFGRVEKVIDYKNHILQFSGFAWHESEDKQKTKVKEKLDKCTKDTLLDFCDLFDIPVLKAKSNARKEELVAMLLDFLVAPHVTTDVILSEKEQECIKKPKTKEKSAHDEEEDDEIGVPAEDDEPENSEGKEKKFESEEPENSKGKEKEFKSEEAAEDDKEKDPEEKSSGKKVDKGEEGKSKESGESCPSMEHMRDEIKCFLRGYDLFTVTFDGMIEHFNILGIDLTTRKEAVQLMLQEEMEKIDNDYFHLEFEGCDNNQWQFQSDLFFPTKKEESRNMKKEESEDSKTEKTNGMMKKANTEDTKKEEAKDMEKEETDYVQEVEMEDREAEDSKLLEGKNVIKERDNKDVEGKVEEIKEAEGGAEGSRKKWIRGQKGSEKGEAEEKKESENKAKEGRGIPLKDIPNVAHKVGKKKPAELKLLHQTLFGGVEKAIDYKNHILQFSGFAWHESEDKQKTKVKEKLDKCTKDTLLDFCDLFDISALKAKSKERKEELVAMLLDFMVAPHVTTDVILSEKEQSSKSRKRKKGSKDSGLKKSGLSGKRSRKECIKKPKTKERSAHDEEEDDENGVPAEDDEPENSEGKEKEFESEETAEDDKETDPEEKSSGKNVDKGEEGKSKESWESGPSMEHMRDMIKCFLRSYDLFTVTFDDMIEHFGIWRIDLTTRKEAVNLMLQEEMEIIDNDYAYFEFGGDGF